MHGPCFRASITMKISRSTWRTPNPGVEMNSFLLKGGVLLVVFPVIKGVLVEKNIDEHRDDLKDGSQKIGRNMTL